MGSINLAVTKTYCIILTLKIHMQTHARHFLHNISFHHKSFNITVVRLILDTSEVPCVKHLGFILLIISTLTKCVFTPTSDIKEAACIIAQK